MSTHLPGFQTFLVFLHHFVLSELATNGIRVNVVREGAKSREIWCGAARSAWLKGVRPHKTTIKTLDKGISRTLDISHSLRQTMALFLQPIRHPIH